MLKYLWMVIQDLFVAVTLVSMIHAMIHTRFGKESLRIHWAGIAAGVVSSIILAIVKNTTNKIISSRWNHRIYAVILLFTVAFLVFVLLTGRKERQKPGIPRVLTCLAGAGLSASWIFYALPGVLLYPL